MPLIPSASIENNFIGGLKTEFTGLNFPENSSTDCDNVVFEVTGDVNRRWGFDYEDNYTFQTVDRTGKAMSSYVWSNVAGNGSTKFLVKQIGSTLYFYDISKVTTSNSLSSQILVDTVDIAQFIVADSDKDPKDTECEYADGNGYLFVYHPYCDTFYCLYDTTELSINFNPINIQTRDFKGVSEGGVQVSLRPPTLTDFHKYNLINQGWTAGGAWTSSSTVSSPTFSYINPTSGVYVFTVTSGMTVTIGQTVTVYRHFGTQLGGDAWYDLTEQCGTGVVSAYSGTSMTINISGVYGMPAGYRNYYFKNWVITPTSTGYIDKWFTDIGAYPSNSDVWWRYKNSSDVFDPSGMIAKTTANAGAAPKGKNILYEFNQRRSSLTGIPNIVDVTTIRRPRVGTWFAGRVWYSGVDDFYSYTAPSSSTSSSYDWSENIYFSKIVESTDDFGLCYQTNDPTSDTLFNELPDDGGVISIPGCGKIYKLFPIQNGMLVFCQNGIWFITGSQGIGFTANDYTITNISAVQSINSSSFVNVQGIPFFWNEDGIYTVTPAQQGLGLSVESITVSTIRSFYSDIPRISKQYVRGAYDPINYVLTFIYKSEVETDITSRYEFDRCLNFNTHLKCFYPYTLEGDVKINGINYFNYPSSTTAPEPKFKYMCSIPYSGSYRNTFAEEKDEDYVDFESAGEGTNYVSYFVTGYKLRGQAQRQWQAGYVIVYSRNEEDTAYKIQAIFDYANDPNSGRFSSNQLITNSRPNYGMVIRRHKLRGHGYAGQIKITSVDGEPFDIMGWSIYETSSTGV